MSFALPLWLWALVPWGGVALWLLWGRRRRVRVPFLELWKGPATTPPPKRAFLPPPAWVALAMVAMLGAILAASGPVVVRGGSPGRAITILVDRGLTMSGRIAATVQTASEALAGFPVHSPVDLVFIPGDVDRTDLSDWASLAASAAPTAADTQSALIHTARQRLAGSGGAGAGAERSGPWVRRLTSHSHSALACGAE